jgi:SAM-dependent MidA family methyltransferase
VDPQPSAGVPPLLARIADEIRERGPIPFARFMDLALHDGEHGYYSRGAAALGRGGDFFTASDVGTFFGQCMARQLFEMDGLLGRPPEFAAIEFGAGRGLLARDVLDAAPAVDLDFSSRLRYVMADRSRGMRKAAGRGAPEATAESPDAVGARPAGCVLAVELFDALAVHRLRRRDGRLREIFVDLGEGGALVEREGDPAPEAESLARRYGAAAREGEEAEVCPAAGEQLDVLDSVLERGFVLVVDYGHPAEELYGPTRPRGTLLAYHRHATNEDFLLRVGEQDLTAHVNFTQLQDRARELGLAVLGITTQDRFLIANGILREFEDEAGDHADPARVRARLRAMQLIHPEGMGRIFKVLILSKGIDPPPRLQGLTDPFRF